MHFYEFSPEGVFKCVLKLPVCTFMRFPPLLRGPKVSWNCRCKITLFVFVQFFSIMSFQLYNWRMQNHIVFIFTILSPEWVLECVLKLPVWTDSQFHWLNLYVFSYGSSIYLKLHMQSHIVCICTIANYWKGNHSHLFCQLRMCL